MRGVILAPGSINAAFQVRLEPPFGDADTVKALGLERFGGDKAATLAHFTRRLSHHPWLRRGVGEDLAAQVLDPVRRAGVDPADVALVVGCETGFAVDLVPPSGRKRKASALKAPSCPDRAALDAMLPRWESCPPR